MDMPLQARRRRPLLGWGIAIAVVVTGLLATALLLADSDRKLDRSSFSLMTVQQGDVAFQISAYGILVPRREKLITSPGAATVEEILGRPGDPVVPGTALVRLNSPEIIERRAQAKIALDQALLALREAELSLRMTEMEEGAKLRALEAQSKLDEAERNALRPIAEQGIVAKLEMRRVEAKVAAVQAQVVDQRERMKIALEVTAARVVSHRDAHTEAKSAFDAADAITKSLHVRSTVTGQIQDIYVSSGQGVIVGEKMVLLTEDAGLKARLKVPQGRIGAVTVGAPVILDVQGRVVRGKVDIIDPRVREGVVQVEATLDQGLPDWVRAEQAVTAKIGASATADTVYVKRGMEVAPFIKREIFVLQGSTMRKRNIEFGAQSGDFVEVAAGARPGEQLAVGLEPGIYKRDEVTVAN